jgi:hypothetical protein
MAYQYSSTPLYVREGDLIQFRYTAPPLWDYTETITIQIGGLVQFWYITTVPEDFEPDPFPFQRVINAELETLYVYADGSRPGEEIITVSGLTPTTQAPVSLVTNIVGANVNTYSLRIDYNDGNGFTDWFLPAENTVVENGHRIQVRLTTGPNANQNTRLTLGIGLGYETWTVRNKAIPLNIPEPFPDFDDLNGQPVNTPIYSNVIRIQGLLGPASVSVDNGAEYAISNSDVTFTNDDGFDVLSGATFTSAVGTIDNGQYLQLKLQSSSVQFSLNQTALSIGDQSQGSVWQVTTGANPSTTPNSFIFPDVNGAIEDFLQPSQARPLGGITGLGNGITVPVTLISTTASEVKIKINNGSIGVFPASVRNGDTITLYAKSSADFGGLVETQIRVGNLAIPTWQVITNTGPDYDAVFTPPSDRSNQVPESFVSSSPVTITGINRPITITATNGALISIDYDEPSESPRIFDPAVNSIFYLVLQANTGLLTEVDTTVVVGTEATNVNAVTFTWTVTTYASPPPPATNLGVWYSKKTEKFDGYPIGTVIPIFKESIVTGYGDLSGDLGSRYAGFVECDGSSYPADRFPALWQVIKNTYGGNATYNGDTGVYTGNFNVPDYRNRRLAGTGFVDGTNLGSSFLPVSTVGKGIFDVAAEGGYWYFDKVDVAGSNPFEQVEGSGTTGTISNFFTIGTVKVTGLETVTESVSFNVSGTVIAQVGPVGDTLVSVPVHSHLFVSAVIESDGGDPCIPWTSRALFSTVASVQVDDIDVADAAGYAEDSRNKFKQFLRNEISGPNPKDFPSEVGDYNPAYKDLDVFVADVNFPPPVGGGLGFNETSTDIDWMVLWTSPASALDGPISQGKFAFNEIPVPSTTRLCTAVIDTNPSAFRIDAYTPPTGSTNSHSHYMTLSPVEDPNTDFSGGNTAGPGIIGAPFGSGLGGATSSIQLSFTQSEVNIELTDATFELNSSVKKPVPDVALSPQRQVPILNPFHKAKYLIKAY